MFRLVRRLRDSSKLDNIVSILISIILLRIFSLTVCLKDLTFRLSPDVVPVDYVLQLHPNFTSEFFNGEVSITIDIFDEQPFIALHAKDLTIRSVRLSFLTSSNNDTSFTWKDVKLKNFYAVNHFDMIVIEAASFISSGKYSLSFSFNGTMSKENRGIFMINYSDPYTGKIRKIATTRFTPTHARRAFPCFDEPSFKAMFDIRLVQPNIEGYHSLSNMPAQHLQRDTPQPGLTTVYFTKSLPISTYLVTFIISDFVNRTTRVATRWEQYQLIPLAAWTTSEKMIRLDLVMHMTYRSLDFYQRLYHMNYPLPKIDVVAIPGFISGAMNNWGLILYDEPTMLYFPRSNSVDELKISTNRLNNGLVHMWFGNLVTLRWWNDEWLAKSFAAYMQHYTTNWGFPDWKEVLDFPESAIESFLVDDKFPSMTRDALVMASPIIQPTDSPRKVNEFLKSLSIIEKKGASILRMLHYMMGDQNFFYGITNYFEVYRFNAAGVNEFLMCLQRFHFGDENLTQFVDTWTIQSGFPVLNIERIDDIYYINQSRYVSNDVTFYNPGDSPYLYRWDLPLFYTTSMSNGTKKIFLPYNCRIQLLVDKQVNWVKFNTNSIGYYTINYDLRTWERFVDALLKKPEDFRILDRVDLINDAFLNADAGRIPYRIPMLMLECTRFDTDYTPWQLLYEKLLSIHTIVRDTEISKDFEAFVRDLIDTIYSLVDWDVHPLNSFVRRRVRVVVLKIACVVGMKKCIEEVTRKFRFWISNPNIRPHPDVKEIIYYYGMLNAGERNDWDIVYNLFLVEPDIQERQKLMMCLTAIKNSTILIKYLEIAKDTMVISKDDYLKIFHAATLNPLDPTVIWDYYKKNWNFLVSRYSEDEIEFTRLIIPVMSKFRGSYHYYEAIKFFEKHPCSEPNVDARREALEIVRNNLVWMERNYMQLKNYLEDFYKKKK